MKLYLTPVEIAAIIRRPIGTVYRLASRDKWRRSADGRRPVLYDADDVGKTISNLSTPLDS